MDVNSGLVSCCLSPPTSVGIRSALLPSDPEFSRGLHHVASILDTGCGGMAEWLEGFHLISFSENS